MNTNRRLFITRTLPISVVAAAALAKTEHAFGAGFTPNSQCAYDVGLIIGNLIGTAGGTQAQNDAAAAMGEYFMAGALGDDCKLAIAALIANLTVLFPSVSAFTWNSLANALVGKCCKETP